jgi:hypothetical protein
MSAFSGPEPEPHQNDLELISAFRTHYYRFEQAVHEATAVSADSNVLARLCDDLDEYSDLLTQVCAAALHQENNTLLGWLEMLESTRIARNTRSSFKFLKKILQLSS